MRLFIAIDFDKEREYFAELQKKINFPDANLTFTRKFHLTLKFLGEVQPNKVEPIKSLLESINPSKFSVHLDSTGVFPSELYIRVVWIGLKPEEPVLELQSKIDNSLQDMFKKEKNFKAHITLARVKFVKNKEDFINQLENIKIEPRIVNVHEFLLVKSDLKPTGPIYTTISKFQLG